MSRRRRYFANNNDALIPEMWAETALVELQENMVAANLVHRDFQNLVATKGDVVNAHRPADFSAVRKAKTSNITLQDATSDNIQVPLNQLWHVAFAIEDVDLSRAFKDLIPLYLQPGAKALASRIDATVNGAAWRFRANMGGNLAAAVSKTSLLQSREKLVTNKAPIQGRFGLLPPAMATTLLGTDEFIHMEKSGSTAGLIEASLGRKFGLDLYEAQNAPTVLSTLQPATAAGALDGAHSAGATTLTVDGFVGDKAPAGSFVNVAGDDRPRRVSSSSLTSGNTTEIVLATGLRAGCSNDAVVTAYGKAVVNLTAGYAAGYEETIAYDGAGTGKAPQVGQLCAFGSAATEYTIVAVTDAGDGTGTIELDRPLVAAITNDTSIFLGPTGSYGFVGHKNALALVVRPLALPQAGVQSAVAFDERIGAAIRVSIQYSITTQKTIVVMDVLGGIAVLDENLGVLLMSSDAAVS